MFGLGRKENAAPQAAGTYSSIVTWEKGHVRASVIELDEGTARLMGVAAAPVHGIGRTSHPDLDRWYTGCNQALTQAEDMTLASCGRKVVLDSLIMSVPAEVTRSLPVVVSLRRQEPAHGVILDELRFLLQRGYRKAQDVVGTGARESPMKGTAGRVVGEDIIHGVAAEILLDGRAVTEPVGLHGRQLEMRMSFVLAPMEWIRTLEIVAERLQTNLVAIVPQHVAYASPLTDPAALLVLLDEQHTTVSLVRHGRPEWTTLAQLGERDLVSATAEALGLRGRQADALMRAYRAGQLRDDVERQLAQTFWIELRRWMVTLGERVKAAKESDLLPYHVYFSDLTRRIPEAEPALQTPFWEGCLPFERCPEITPLGLSTMRNVLDCTSQATGSGYLPLRALAHYVAQLYVSTNVLDRALLESIRWRRPGQGEKIR